MRRAKKNPPPARADFFCPPFCGRPFKTGPENAILDGNARRSRERGEGRVESIACFTGHRPSRRMRFDPGSPAGRGPAQPRPPGRAPAVPGARVRVFLCGMAAGFDLFAARCMLELRCAGQIPQETCLGRRAALSRPRRGRPNGWQHVYDEVLQHCQDQCIVSPRKSAAAFRRRNDYMTARADYVLAYWNHDPRTGTGQTVRMAHERERVVLNLYDL